MTVWLFCYDVSDTKRLHKVAKTLEKFGIRLQKSFFQIRASKENKEKVKKAILKILNLKYDRLNIYPICEKCYSKSEIVGKGVLVSTEEYFIL